MNTNSTAWLIIRLIGLILIAIGFYQLYVFIINVIVVITHSHQPIVNNTLNLISLRWEPFLGFIFFSILSLYFLKYGQGIQKLLVKEGRNSENPIQEQQLLLTAFVRTAIL